MIRRFSVNFALFSIALDLFSVSASLRLASFFRPYLNSVSWIRKVILPELVPDALYFLFPLLWILIFSAFSIYDGRKYLRIMDEFSALSLSILTASVSSAGILYLSYREVSRALFLSFVILAFLFCVTWRVFIRMYFRNQKTPPSRIRRVVAVGAGPLGRKVRDQLLGSGAKDLVFVGFLDEPAMQTEGDTILGELTNVRNVLDQFDVTDVVITLPHSAYHKMGEIVRKTEDKPVRLWVALGFFDLALYRTSIEDFEGVPMLDLRASAMDDYQHMLKRAFDLVFGSFALLIALPLMLISTLMIYLDDGTPILFKQKRVGANGKLFDMLKFRTMVRNAEQLQSQGGKRDAEGNPIHKFRDDPRVTRVGRYLRRFSLDELPQFINVLRGDMSLVGPRPEMPWLVDKYQPWQRKRFAVPPGITGWWQVNGRSDRPMHLHTEDDLYYIQNFSILLDIQILLKTIWVVLLGRGSY